MTNRFPLILNTASSTIQELPSGDNLDLSGSNISNVGNITGGNSFSANYFVGNLYGQANTAVTATSATTAGTVTTNAQPNITSTGTLTSVTVSGTSNLGAVGNVKVTGGSANQYLQTDGAGNLTFASVNGDSYTLKPVKVATTANVTLSGTSTIDGIATSVGDRVLVLYQDTNTQNGVYVIQSGAWTRATDFTTGSNTLMGGIIVPVISGAINGSISFICTVTTSITIGSTSITFERVNNNGFISIWSSAGSFITKATGATNSGASAIGVGAIASVDGTSFGYVANAGSQGVSFGYASTSGTSGVAMGVNSNASGSGAISIGRDTASPGVYGVAVGYGAKASNSWSISIGLNAAGSSSPTVTPGTSAVAIGFAAGYDGQGANSIAIGRYAGQTTQGANSIAIGANAGYTSQGSNSIILNATGANLDQTTANSFTVKPVRSASTGNVLYYNSTSGEITYSTAPGGSSLPFAIIASSVFSINIPVGTGNVLNTAYTEVVDANNLATVTTGSFTLIAGTYTVNVTTCPIFVNVNNGSAGTAYTGDLDFVLYNDTDAATVDGQFFQTCEVACTSGTPSPDFLLGSVNFTAYFTIASTKTFSLRTTNTDWTKNMNNGRAWGKIFITKYA